MSDERSNATGPRSGLKPGLRVLLFTSLALNLLVAGLVIGAVVGHRFGEDGPRPPRLDRAGGPMTMALSHEDRHAIGLEMRKAYREKRPTRADMRAEYARVIAALRAVPFDPSAVRAAMDRQMAGIAARGELGRDLLLHRLETMSDDDRSAYAERLEEVIERRAERFSKRRTGEND